MGGKGSGRPKGSYKPLSEVFAGIQEELADLEDYVYKKCYNLRMRIGYHRLKQMKLEENRRKFREAGKK